jgi:hypothetical protein
VGGGSGEASSDAGADATDTATDTAESDAGSGAADTTEDGSGSGATILLDYVTTPADGAVGVALDAQVLIDFNQPMNEIRFTPTTVRVTDYAGAILERQLFYDQATDTLVLSGTETTPLFKPSTPYEVRLSDRLQAMDGQMLETPRTFGFATAAAPSAFYAELAEAYAPVLYQEVKTAAVDLPTTVDFDGDTNAANNFVGSNGANAAAVYWTVTESRSHYFVGYWLYYPRVQLNPTAVAEHDWVFAQVIVGKSVDRLGYFVAMSTIYHEVYSLFAAEASLYPAGTTQRNALASDWRFVDERLDGLLDFIGQLAASTVEELDAVVIKRVVRSGDNHAKIAAEVLRHEGDARGGQRPDELHIDARSDEASLQSTLEQIAGHTGVLANEHRAATFRRPHPRC